MAIHRCANVCLIVIFLGNMACADGMFFRLPKDGTWASYDVDIKLTTNAGNISLEKKIRIASVGQTIIDGQLCRWIEVQAQLVTSVPQPKTICKMLIPEKYLVQGEMPFEHVLRVWVRMEAPDPFGFEIEMTTDPKDLNENDAMLPIIFAGPCEESKLLDDVQVNTKYGKLMCKGVKGIYEFINKANTTTKCEVNSLLHPLSPYGVVISHWKEISGDGKGEIVFTLAEYGDGAISTIKRDDNHQTTSSPTCSGKQDTIPFIKYCGGGGKTLRCRKHCHRRWGRYKGR